MPIDFHGIHGSTLYHPQKIAMKMWNGFWLKVYGLRQTSLGLEIFKILKIALSRDGYNLGKCTLVQLMIGGGKTRLEGLFMN